MSSRYINKHLLILIRLSLLLFFVVGCMPNLSNSNSKNNVKRALSSNNVSQVPQENRDQALLNLGNAEQLMDNASSSMDAVEQMLTSARANPEASLLDQAMRSIDAAMSSADSALEMARSAAQLSQSSDVVARISQLFSRHQGVAILAQQKRQEIEGLRQNSGRDQAILEAITSAQQNNQIAQAKLLQAQGLFNSARGQRSEPLAQMSLATSNEVVQLTATTKNLMNSQLALTQSSSLLASIRQQLDLAMQIESQANQNIRECNALISELANDSGLAQRLMQFDQAIIDMQLSLSQAESELQNARATSGRDLAQNAIASANLALQKAQANAAEKNAIAGLTQDPAIIAQLNGQQVQIDTTLARVPLLINEANQLIESIGQNNNLQQQLDQNGQIIAEASAQRDQGRDLWQNAQASQNLALARQALPVLENAKRLADQATAQANAIKLASQNSTITASADQQLAMTATLIADIARIKMMVEMLIDQLEGPQNSLEEVLPILQASCFGCHSGQINPNLSVLTSDQLWIQSGLVIPKNPALSRLFASLKGTNVGGRANMPPGPALAPAQISLIRGWIENLPEQEGENPDDVAARQKVVEGQASLAMASQKLDEATGLSNEAEQESDKDKATLSNTRAQEAKALATGALQSANEAKALSELAQVQEQAQEIIDESGMIDQSADQLMAKNNALIASLENGQAQLERFNAAMVVIQAKCMGCHGRGSSSADFSGLQSENDWKNSIYITPRNPNQSRFFRSIRGSNTGGPENMPRGGGSISPQEVNTIRVWIENMTEGNGQAGGGSGQGGGPNIEASAVALTASPRIGNKHFIKNTLDFIFGSSARNYTFDNILGNASVFGGSCNLMEGVRTSETRLANNDPARCFGGLNDTGLAPNGQSSTLRSGWLITACQYLTQNQATRDFAIERSLFRSGAVRSPDRSIIISAYQLFYPEKNPSDNVIQALTQIAGTGSNNTQRNQRLLYAVCATGDWQAP